MKIPTRTMTEASYKDLISERNQACIDREKLRKEVARLESLVDSLIQTINKLRREQ